MQFKPSRTTPAPLRLTDEIRLKAKTVAADQGISEANVYRQIIEDFFCDNRQLSVVNKTTISNQNA